MTSAIVAITTAATNSNNNNNNNTLLADILAPFAEAASIRLRDASNTLKKRIIVSLNFCDTHKLHGSLFGENDHFDWSAAQDYLNSVNLTTADWLQLIAPLHFINEPAASAARQHVAEMIASTLAGIRVSMQGKKALTPLESMRLCFARAGLVPSWDILCKALLLVNLADIDTAAALSNLLMYYADVPDLSSGFYHPFISKK